jgi:hypothetical protein
VSVEPRLSTAGAVFRVVFTDKASSTRT